MTVNNNYQIPGLETTLTPRFIQKMADIVSGIMNGKTNNTGEVTLTASATTTLVKDILCNANSVILLSAITAHAAAATGVYVVAGDKEFTIHHNSTADTDKDFRYVIVG